MMAEFFFIINPLAFLCKSEKKIPTVRANLHVYEFLRIMHCGTNCWAWNSNVTAYYIITAKKHIIDKTRTSVFSSTLMSYRCFYLMLLYIHTYNYIGSNDLQLVYRYNQND